MRPALKDGERNLQQTNSAGFVRGEKAHAWWEEVEAGLSQQQAGVIFSDLRVVMEVEPRGG